MTNPKTPRTIRFNLWLANRVWIAIIAFATAAALFGACILLLSAQIRANTNSIDEFRYRSCIEDAVLEYKIAEGQVIDDAFSRDEVATARDLIPYRAALKALRETQTRCRASFPAA